jgi:epoxide hydrolase-like predicted phosphatase
MTAGRQAMIKAVIFDMGGVILRTEDPSARLAQSERLGISRQQLENIVFDSPSALQATLGLITEKEHWEEVFKILPVPAEEQADFMVNFWSGDKMDRDLLSFIDGLRPTFRTGLLSNAWSEARTSVSARFGGLDVFDVTVFSAEIGLAKPDPMIYKRILQQLEVEANQAVFVDDYLPNVEAAAALGMGAVRFLNMQQAQVDVRAILNHTR